MPETKVHMAIMFISSSSSSCVQLVEAVSVSREDEAIPHLQKYFIFVSFRPSTFHISTIYFHSHYALILRHFVLKTDDQAEALHCQLPHRDLKIY